jgi:peptidoglycan hydrolase CwlO-like protein
MRKPSNASHPPELSHSVSSLSSSNTSQKRSSSVPCEKEQAATRQESTEIDPPPYGSEESREGEGRNPKQNHSNLGYETSLSREKDTFNSATESREPTFSSEGTADPDATPVPGIRSVHFSQAISSPAPLATPTPVYPPNTPRYSQQTPRNNLAVVEEDQESDDALTTPFNRRKSFLLSIVNSTTRPRLSKPSPHPRAAGFAMDITGGMTPRPTSIQRAGMRRPRLSHPLQQMHNFNPTTPYGGSTTENEDNSSPEGPAGASYISTASSHDLTVHHRANASFDPGQGFGRFNAGKLNTYLHGLNRRLQEENEILADRIRSQQTEIEYLQSRSRHLSGVVEDDKAEEWMQEKERLEQNILELQQTLEATEQRLGGEQEERMRDKERWKERMIEVETGVEQIISDLQEKLAQAEAGTKGDEGAFAQLRETQSQLEDAEHRYQVLKGRTDEVESLLASKEGLGSALRDANDSKNELQDRIRTLVQELHNKDTALATSHSQVADMKAEIESLQNKTRNLHSDIRVANESIDSLREELRETRRDHSDASNELRKVREHISKLKADLNMANDKAQNYEKLLADVEHRLHDRSDAMEAANEQVAISAASPRISNNRRSEEPRHSHTAIPGLPISQSFGVLLQELSSTQLRRSQRHQAYPACHRYYRWQYRVPFEAGEVPPLDLRR